MGCCGFVLILPYFLLWTDYFQFQININCVWFGKTYLWAVWVGQLVIRAVDLCCDRELGLAADSCWQGQVWGFGLDFVYKYFLFIYPCVFKTTAGSLHVGGHAN